MSSKLRPSSASDSAAEQLLHEFELSGLLGTGAYGSVYRVTHIKTKVVAAIKKIELTAGEPIQTIANEINLIRDLDSKYIVKYLGSFFVKPHLNIVMEFCEAGSVADVMRLRQQIMNEAEIAAILSGTIKGLSYMHSKLHIHRDIKAGNVLLGANGSVKLADFGVAGQLSETTQKRKTVIGSPFWMAPEIIQEVGHDSLADIWSTGILALEMAEGRPPYADIHPMRVIFKIAASPPATFAEPTAWSADFREVVSHCLVKEPKNRFTADQLLGLPFITKSENPEKVLAKCIADSMKIMADKLNNSGTIAPDTANKHTHVPNATKTPKTTNETKTTSTQPQEQPQPPPEPEPEEEFDFGTMVISDDATIRPDFMKHFREEAQPPGALPKIGQNESGTGSGSHTPTLATQEHDLGDLRMRLEKLANDLSNEAAKLE